MTVINKISHIKIKQHFNEGLILTDLMNALAINPELAQHIIRSFSGATVEYMNTDHLKESVVNDYRNAFWRTMPSLNLLAGGQDVLAHDAILRLASPKIGYYGDTHYPICVVALQDQSLILTANYLEKNYTINTYCARRKAITQQVGYESLSAAINELAYTAQQNQKRCG